MDFIVSGNLPDLETEPRLRLAMIAPGIFTEDLTLESPHNLVVVDNAKGLLPVAVSHATGLINHFFRGRMQVQFQSGSSCTLVTDTASGTGRVQATARCLEEQVAVGGDASVREIARTITRSRWMI